jgi:hypothetical protein
MSTGQVVNEAAVDPSEVWQKSPGENSEYMLHRGILAPDGFNRA